jgi:hypothetical protein
MLDPGAIIVGAAIASSWYLACYFGGRSAFLTRQLDSENVGRFFGSLGAMAPWYYVKPLLLNAAPLSLLVPIAVAIALIPEKSPPEPGAERADSIPNPHHARECVRLLAIFWVVTVIFFSIAAYKRRNYLLPLWPASAVMLAWIVITWPPPRWRRLAVWAFGATCAALVVFNFTYIPRREVRDCGGDSFRPAAEEIARVVGPGEPIYLYGFQDDLAPLLFNLDRTAIVLSGRLGDAPPGYVLVPERVWKENQGQALDLQPVLTSEHGDRRLILLRHGPSYARR